MPKIKTRDYAARTVRSMNRVHNLSARMKSDIVRSKEDQIDEKQYAVDSVESGAAEMLPHATRIGIRNRKDLGRSDVPESVSRDVETKTDLHAETKSDSVVRLRAGTERKTGGSVSVDFCSFCCCLLSFHTRSLKPGSC